jgi:hypothetical protein
MDDRMNVLRGVAFCARLRDLHGLAQDNPSHRCELCGELVWADPRVKMRHLVCADCLPRTPAAWIEEAGQG